VASQNRRRYSLWDAGNSKGDEVRKPGWRTHGKYLSRAKVRDHLRGRDIYGCWGDFATRWFAIDVDYHGDINAIQADVQKVLAFLEDESLGHLLRYKPEKVKDEDFRPLTGLEIYPAANHNLPLPYASRKA
jgi:hypothetical protein